MNYSHVVQYCRLVLAVSFAGFGFLSDADAFGRSHAHRFENVKFATFNASLNRNQQGDLIAELKSPASAQPKVVAEIIQRTNADVILINEFDFDEAGEAIKLFKNNFLEVAQNGAAPVKYPYVFNAPSNTGVASGFDLDNSGTIGGGNDAYGFGNFPGQYGMVVLSKFPIDYRNARTFQKLLWKNMPGALLPDDAATAAPNDYYSPEELGVFRLSSKSHWDLPIEVHGRVIHVLASHPTPPTFDGPEDRNGRRNHDEIRLWADYITPGAGDYIVDDKGRRGGLKPGASFVIMGDQNADPFDGDSYDAAIRQLLDNPDVNTEVTPTSEGGPEASVRDGGANNGHLGDPAFDTADFADTAPGNLRADYVLPSKDLRIKEAHVFWPKADDPLFRLVGTYPFPSSDHRLVWVELLIAKRGHDHPHMTRAHGHR